MKTDSVKIRKVLTLVLLISLFVILIIFCGVYIWSVDDSEANENVAAVHVHHQLERLVDEDHHLDHLLNMDHHGSATDHVHSHSHDENMSDHEDTEVKAPVYKIQFSGKGDATSGKVLIEYSGAKGFVCSDGFDNADALVVCRELGYKKGRAYNLMSSFPYSRYTELKPFLTELQCTGTEARLKDCKGFDLQNITVCTWFAAAICYDDIPYEMRLVNGMMPDSGLVEMKVGGEWGVVCAIRNFDDEVADILCRSMNFTGGFALERGLLGSSSLSKVWVPYVSCMGGPEIKSILDCSLVLNPENIIIDHIEHRNNRYSNEYMSCLSKPNSFAVAVQCLL